jgi:hypothetical protein
MTDALGIYLFFVSPAIVSIISQSKGIPYEECIKNLPQVFGFWELKLTPTKL